jgi:hypothetical protein
VVAKVELKKQLTRMYGPSAKEVSVVDVPRMNFLTIDGRGDPNTSEEYADARQSTLTIQMGHLAQDARAVRRYAPLRESRQQLG